MRLRTDEGTIDELNGVVHLAYSACMCRVASTTKPSTTTILSGD